MLDNSWCDHLSVYVSTPGNKTIYVWSKDDSGRVSDLAKTIHVQYVAPVLLGQTDYQSIRGLVVGSGTPTAVKYINNKLYVVHRDVAGIFVYNSIPTTSLQVPDYNIGRSPQMLNANSSTGPNSFYQPYSVSSDGTKFAVVDTFNHRVLIWNSIPTGPNDEADVVIGQQDFYQNTINAGKGSGTDLLTCADLNYPRDVKFYNDKLLITDTDNNRVLIWNIIPTSNYVAADIVMGQTDCSSRGYFPVSQSTMRKPYDLLIFPGSPDKLLVTDSSNNRLLIFNSFPTANAPAADLVLGQSSFTGVTANSGGISKSTFSTPVRMATNGTKLIVSDITNSRLLIWNTFPTANKQTADVVLMQTTPTGYFSNQSSPISGGTSTSPAGLEIIDGDLWLADSGNHRVLKFNGIPTTDGEAATFVLGQQSINKQNTSYNGGVSDATFNRPIDLAFHGGGMFVSDFGANRLVKFNSIPTTDNESFDLLYGQTGLNDMQNRNSSYTTAGNNLVDPGLILIFNSLGQDKMVISDMSQNRILIYNQIIDDAADLPDVVLGQPDLVTRTANNGGVSLSSLHIPTQVATDGTYFAVVDMGNNRVLLWNSIPTTNNQAADVVLGQPNATSNSENNGGVSASSMHTPRGVAIVNGKLIVADTENARLLIWNSMPTSHGQAADIIIGQSSATNRFFYSDSSLIPSVKPVYLQFINNQLITTDFISNRILIWDGLPTVTDQIPDRAFGGHFNPAYRNDLAGRPSQFTNANIFSPKSDGFRLFIPDYGAHRIAIREIPEVSILSDYMSKNRNVEITVHNCLKRSKVLFNEGTRPSASDGNWSSCRTDKNFYNYTVSAGDGIKVIKVWFKDEDGYVLPENHQVHYFLNTKVKEIRGVTLTTSSPTNSTNIEFASAAYKNDVYTSPVKYYFSTSSTAPTIIDSSWVAVDETNSMTLPASTSGLKNIYLWWADAAGNISDYSLQFKLTYDIDPPINPPIATLTSRFLIGIYSTYRFTMTDCNDADKILVNEGTQPAAASTDWQTCTTTDHGISYSAFLTSFGTRTFKIWSKDKAGNVSTNPQTISDTQSAGIVLGQTDFETVAGAENGLSFVRSVDSDGTRFIVADQTNARVLIYHGDPLLNSPSIVLGQANKTRIGCNNVINGATANVTAATLCNPTDATIVGEKVIVADSHNNRVLIWNSIPTTDGAPADIVLGQMDFTSGDYNINGSTKNCSAMYRPTAVWSDGTKLIVGDYSNNRILIWNTIPTTNYTAADIVVGQASCTGITGATTQSGLNNPSHGIIFDNKLIVSDRGNNRVLIYNTVPTTHGALADVVIGQAIFTTATGATTAAGLKTPNELAIHNNKLYVTDITNSRIVIFNSIPSTSGASGDVFIGKSSGTATTPTTGLDGLYTPYGFFVNDDYLWVADAGNNKIKKFSMPLSTGMSATAYLGGFNTSNNGTNQRSTEIGTAESFSLPNTAVIVGTKFVVSDWMNNRVLIWNSIPTTNNQAADVVIGQPDKTSVIANNPALADQGARLYRPFGLATDGTKLFISDSENNRVLVYNDLPTSDGATASFVLGQTSLSGITANRGGSAGLGTLKFPTRIFLNANRLYVADSYNHRVLLWTTIPTTTGTSANYVIGQTTTSGGSSSVSQSRLNNPQGVFEDNGKVFVLDTSNNRVLIWNSIPSAHGALADVVIGQSNFTAAGTKTDSLGFSGPRGLNVINGKIFVSDTYNNRIMIYNSVPTTSGVSVDQILGQRHTTKTFDNSNGLSGFSFSMPYDIIYDGASYWIMDAYNHRVLKLNLSL